MAIDQNDSAKELNAVAAKVGIDGSAVNTSHDYKLSRVATGDKALAILDMRDNLFMQALINGNFDVWQRGTSIAMTAANAYTADRWYAETATAGTDKTVSQQDGTGVEGSNKCARVAMVQDQDELLTFSQALESQDSIKFRGKKLTLSFWARGGAEFVADNPTLVCKIVTGKGTDQKVLAFTTSADAVSANETLTTGWQKFTITTSAVIASDITQIGISFAFTHAGSGTTTNYFEITQVQLNAGDVALPFQAKSYEEEFKKCLRYFQLTSSASNQNSLFSSGGFNYNTTLAICTLVFYVPMRTTPTLSVSAANHFIVSQSSGNQACTDVSINQANEYKVAIGATVASGLTAGAGCCLNANATTSAQLKFDSEF
ncbi:MAG: hypothetical protein PHV59_08105 [Victivallales bacterium]|nr:hypothetical protein [Victivallales bacterium]